MKYDIEFRHGHITRKVQIEAENVHEAVKKSWSGIPRNYWLASVISEDGVVHHKAHKPPTSD
jgi:hypothetical protein